MSTGCSPSVLPCSRFATSSPERWPDKLAKLCFWSLNIGLAWMMFATLLPLGVLQLYQSVSEGYYEARTLGSSPSRATRAGVDAACRETSSSWSAARSRSCGSAWLGVRYTDTRMPVEALYTELDHDAQVPALPGGPRGSDADGRPRPAGVTAPVAFGIGVTRSERG